MIWPLVRNPGLTNSPNAGSTRTVSSGHKVFFPLFALRVRDGTVQRKEVHGRFGFFQCQRESQIVKGIAFEDGSELLVDQLECPCICVVLNSNVNHCLVLSPERSTTPRLSFSKRGKVTGLVST